ncbi:HRDC domain-containing protein [Desulfonema limicola]|uniref:HRDC domain-containing protein n=1 Tax=Desulfonema limicola TaxID=45656 RepID=A0A975GFY8_9BACT|nr:HRDC domain-containing protein [Desulfonema limicola]QTA79723.1 HRDC domain-containing protein [Desulfonema limicola]
MSLQYRYFAVPFKNMSDTDSELQREINKFLRSVNVINTRQEFVAHGDNSFWTLSVEYLAGGDQKTGLQTTSSGKKKIDYREVLSPEDFALYAKLRDWRKETAAKEGTAVYAVLVNEQMAQIAQNKVTTKAELKKIDKIGEGRIEKYGDAVINIVKEHIQSMEKKDEKTREFIPSDTETGKPESSIQKGSQRKIPST